MNLIENKTKFTHLSKPSWGVGIYRGAIGDYISVEFEKEGMKKFSRTIINTMLKIVEETEPHRESGDSKQGMAAKSSIPTSSNVSNGALIQYDGESDDSLGKNVIKAFEGNDSIIFNETYTIIGEHTEALKIHAMYDLTIIGDITAQECVVNGSLTVIGTARIGAMTCYNDFVCKGDLHCDKIYIGGDMIVGSVECDELVCDGNVAIQTTININMSAKIGKTVVACEGIMGAGKFSAINAIANEYFEFDGEYKGKIVELETDNTISDTASSKAISAETVEDAIGLANQKLLEEYSRCPEMEEEAIKEYLGNLCAAECSELCNLQMVEPLFSQLIDISYRDKIETIEEYLTVLTAQKVLPSEVFSYESIEHIGKDYISKAKEEIDVLPFEPTSIQQFAKVLSMAVQFESALSEEWEMIMDRIFESVGLKYSTVSAMIGRNNLSKTTESKIADDLPGKERQKTESVVARMNKTDFLGQKLSSVGKRFGLTDVELERLATLRLRTLGDFITVSEDSLVKVFGKKAFLANHLLQIRKKIADKLVDME